MYKKIVFLCALFCPSIQHAYNLTPWFEIKPSYFLFTSSVMHDVYHKGGFEIQGSVSVPFYDLPVISDSSLEFYTSIGIRGAWGHALNSGEKTKLIVMPFDIGLKPVFRLCEHYYYFFAIGPRFFYFNQHNDSLYVSPKVSGGGVGFFINTGCNIQIMGHFLIGIVGEYSYETKTISPTMINVYSNGRTQLGGLAFGINFGYLF